MTRQADAEALAQLGTGRTPLIWAIVSGRPDLVEKLITRGANLNRQDNEGRTALLWAAFCNDDVLVSELLHRGPFPMLTDSVEALLYGQ